MVNSILVLLMSITISHQNFLTPSTVVASDHDGLCPSEEAVEDIRKNIWRDVRAIFLDQVLPALCPLCPCCACGGQGKWTAIAQLNMTDLEQAWPPNWSVFILKVPSEDAHDQLPPVHVILHFSHPMVVYILVCVEELMPISLEHLMLLDQRYQEMPQMDWKMGTLMVSLSPMVLKARGNISGHLLPQ